MKRERQQQARPRLITPRRLAFLIRVEQRIERRGGWLTYWDTKALSALWLSFDPLAMRAELARKGARLEKRRTVVRGVARPFLVHARVA